MSGLEEVPPSSRKSLFRQEVMDAAAQRLQGEVVVHTPRVLTVVIVGICLLVMIIGTMTLLTPLARKVTLEGGVEPENGLVRIANVSSGILETIHVEEGQLVSKGQPVATFRSATAIDGKDSYLTVSDIIESQRQAGIDRSGARVDMLRNEAAALRERRGLLLASLEEARVREGLHHEQMQIAAASLSRAEQIAASGFLRQADLDTRKNSVLELRRAASELHERVLVTRRELIEIDARLTAIPLELAGLQADHLIDENQAALQEADLQRSADFTVLAPIDGRIATLTARLGQALQPGEALALIIPNGDKMQAVLVAPSRSAGLIEPGQKARIHYAAFPHHRFGVGEGTVLSVSSSAISRSDMGLPADDGEPVFRVLVDIPRPWVTVGRRQVLIPPGTRLTADVQIERRSMFTRFYAAMPGYSK